MQRNGKMHHSTTAVMELPKINLETPASTLEAPAATLEAPAATLETPAATLETPAAESQAPAPLGKRQRSAYRTDSRIEQRLMVAKVTIETVLNDPKLQDVLTPYGYAPTEMRQGQALRAQALAFVQQQHVQAGKQFAAQDAHADTQAQARALYKRHVALARIALRNDRDAMKSLDLSARKETLAGWVLQAQQFYTNALADDAITAKLARSGVTPEQMRTAQTLVEAVADGIVTQQQYKNTARVSKNARDAALRALDRWMLDFIAVARIVLADQPQRLAQLGLARG
jgi:hypothetical protein